MPKRVLFINYEFPPLGGGGGHANQHIAQEMCKLGFDVSVMTSRFGDLPNFEERNGVKIHRIPTLRRSQEKCSVFEMAVFLVMSLFYSVVLHRRIKPDLVICFFSIPCGPAALLLNLLFQTPYIVALRGGDVPGFLPEQLALYHKLSNWLTCWIWKRSYAETANSEGLKDLALRFYNKADVRVIPNGVEERFFFVREAKCKAGEKLTVLTVGRLGEQKKVYRQIECFIRLKNQNQNDIELVIVGDGPLRSNLETIAAQAEVLNKTVFFKGWCRRDEILPYYQNADVFLLTSDFEGMPNVVLEAMASSLAILATDAPGTVELVQNHVNGRLVTCGSLSDMDEILVQWRDNPDVLCSLQKKSYDLAKSYSWPAVAKQYAELAEEALR